jgi:hypothetical protein
MFSKRWIKRNLQIILFLCLDAVVLSCTSIHPYTKQNIYEKKLKGISVFKQEYSYSCNVTALAVVKRFIGYNVDETALRKLLKLEDRKKGMLPHEFIDYAKEAFSDTPYSVVQKNFNSQEEIMDQIISSLESDLPIIMYYSTINDWDKPNYDTHYSVIYGISFKRRIIYISNSYGYLQELSFDEFFEGLSYENYKKEPFLHQFARWMKIIKLSTLFFLANKKSS